MTVHFIINKLTKAFWSIARYRDTGSVAPRPKSGRKKKNGNDTKNDPKSEAQIWSKSTRSGRKIACELNISRERMLHIWKNELGLKPLKFQKVQKLTDGPKKVKLKRAKELLRLHESGQLPNLVFSDEKAFQIEQFVNKQNDRVYLPRG